MNRKWNARSKLTGFRPAVMEVFRMKRLSTIGVSMLSVFVHLTSPAATYAQPAAEAGQFIDLTTAMVVTSPLAGPRDRNAVRVLVEEVRKRSFVLLPVATAAPGDGVPLIVVGQIDFAKSWAAMKGLGEPTTASREGYHIIVDRQTRRAPTVFVVGNDERGVLFGIGRLLRELRLTRGRLQLPAELKIDTAPKIALRGHQLGYRPKTNSYDGWDVAMWEQYIRDLTVFGTNAIELIPPRSDDADDSPHFTLSKIDMMVEMSRIADVYGLDLWIWFRRWTTTTAIRNKWSSR
jgi:hypothetical protein